MAHITRSIIIRTPVESVYEWARDPRHWADWYVGLSAPRRVAGDGGVGTVVEQDYCIAGMSFPIRSRVMEDSIGPEGAHWKGRIEGPLAGEQVISLVPRDGGTEMTMDLDYTVPDAVLTRLANTLVLRRLAGKSTETTLDNLKFICESEARVAPCAA